MPAIVLLLGAGFIAGPVTGVLEPSTDFGPLLEPLVALAVALILFEGGLSLDFAQLRGTSVAVRRLVTFGALIAFALGTLAARLLAGLSWPSALVIGAILVVTGPTVVAPLLRHARLEPRLASLLRWEAILIDPIGALLAVLIYEGVLIANQQLPVGQLFMEIGFAAIWAGLGGYGLGRLVALSFARGHVPEFLKVPTVFAAVLATYAVSDLLLEESGLLTVTVLGVTLANSRIASLTELRRFKEFVTVLLVSGVFIVLTASLETESLRQLTTRDALFVAAVLFLARPASVLLSTPASGLPFRARLLAAWIAPRGIVAVAMAGLFAGALDAQGIADGQRLVALTFSVVIITVVVHGLTLVPFARLLGLGAAGPDGVVIVGSSAWSIALAEKLAAMELPVLIADRNWNRLREARYKGMDVFYGEILSEHAEYRLDLDRFGYLIAATDNDDYNALVCTDFGPEFGRSDVFQIARPPEEEDGGLHNLAVTLGGRPLLSEVGGFFELNARLSEGWEFRSTTLTEDFDADALAAGMAENGRLLLARRGDRLLWLAVPKPPKLVEGDVVLSFGP